MQDETVNIIITRLIRPDAQQAFELAVRQWIPQAAQFPGYLSVLMIRPGSHSDEFGAVLRFRSRADWVLFQEWPAYLLFLEQIRPLLSEEPRVQLHGLEAWFAAGDRPSPPRWKMALLTWLGVSVMVFAVSRSINLVNQTWPWWVSFLLINGLVVAGLTWAVMPLLVKCFRPWLAGTAR